ncbi:hypothetical protein ATCR1_14746 [Agrobacterium tumefaciens CCNWGS0286]|nr:hypothetical protein [Agrobacterium tumefaciens]EHH05398.1 hypothetical protein ATCR1_14746 [Agrobacterium tumefaciens CCNWGS0286]
MELLGDVAFAFQELNVCASLLELAGDVVPASEREFFDIRG